MWRLLLLIAIPLVVMKLLVGQVRPHPPLPGSQAVLSLGFTVICGYLSGKIAYRMGLPKITGYLVSGIFFGPYLLDLLSHTVVKELQLIDQIALSLIALNAGGELRLAGLRKQFRTMAAMLLGLIFICLLGFPVLIALLAPFTPGLDRLPLVQLLAASLLVGVIAVSASPATTIAIITETRARGNFTSLTLSLTVLLDILVVLLFALVMALTGGIFHPEGQIRFTALALALMEIGLSLAVGTGMGMLIHVYLRLVQQHVFLFIMGLILFTMEVSHLLHLELILVFIAAGFYVQNATSAGQHLIEELESNSLPIYVIFFTIAGAALNLALVKQAWTLVSVLVVGRYFFHWLGTYWGGRKTGAPPQQARLSWTALAGQAGITLGLAILVEKNLGPPVGPLLRNLLIGAVAVNQILGPILYRWALMRTGEARSAESAEAEHLSSV